MIPSLNIQQQKKPQYTQPDTMTGAYKGIVVDVCDPFGLGRVRAHVYSLHGDYAGIDVAALPWCEIKHSGRGEFAPPEMFDRVWVTFEAGDKKHPVIDGYWRANPAGRGKLPYSKRVGSEVRPEAWHDHGLYPEARILGCDGPGNALWTEAKFLDDTSLISSVNIMDTGGKQIRVKSIHKQADDYAPIQQVPDATSLADMDLDLCKPTRDGLSSNDNVAGSIELNQTNVSRILQSSDDDFSVDCLVQKGGADSYTVDGTMHRTRQGNAALSMFKDCLALNSSSGVFLSNHFATPRRWDK